MCVEVPSYHTPVLLQEVLSFLVTTTDGIYVDCTLGGGGHAHAIAERLTGKGRLIGIDRDEEAIVEARRRLARVSDRLTIVHGAFGDISGLLHGTGVDAVDGILLDLGVSSHQLDDPARGFSFQSDELLDMRMDRRQGTSAADVVNAYEEAHLVRVLWEFGEEREARRIVRSLLRARPITTTGQLAAAVRTVIKGPRSVKSLARVFQALRIEVNGELEQVQRCLQSVPGLLRLGGRVAVIAYHSLEDRIVKDFFREQASDRIPSGSRFLPDRPRTPELRLLTKKPVTASPDEVRMNARARSAKLRAAERV